jgi:hypothetical protein
VASPGKAPGVDVPPEETAVLSIATMTEERTAASGFSALVHVMPTAQPNAYDRGDVCAIATGNALHLSPATKAWAVRPLIPDGSGGG